MTRLDAILTALYIVAIWLMFVSPTHARQAPAAADPAQIVVTTDGVTSSVQAYGGDLGYPGPSSVDVTYDEHGPLITIVQRIFPAYDERVYLPMVGQ